MTTKRKANHPNFEPKYSAEDKQRFFDVLVETKGDVRAACKRTGFSPGTVRYWLKKADRDGVLPPEAKGIVGNWRLAVESKMENLLFKVMASAEKSLEKATLPQKMEAAQKITTMLRTLRSPAKDLPADSPGQETAEDEALKILARVEGRKGIAFEAPEPESESVS